MTIPHPEILLLAGIAGLYLYDSIVLLNCNEALLMPGRGNRWHILFGAAQFLIQKKEPLLPNPLLPHRPLYRLACSLEGHTGQVPSPIHPWPPSTRLYAPLAPLIAAMAIALFGLIPLGIFADRGELLLLAGLLLFYTSTLLALAWIWFKRKTYQCTGKRFAALAFETLTCPPFALNMVRHLSLALPVSENLIPAGRQLLTTERWQETVDQLLIRIDHEIDWEDENTARAQALATHRHHLQKESSHPPS